MCSLIRDPKVDLHLLLLVSLRAAISMLNFFISLVTIAVLRCDLLSVLVSISVWIFHVVKLIWLFLVLFRPHEVHPPDTVIQSGSYWLAMFRIPFIALFLSGWVERILNRAVQWWMQHTSCSTANPRAKRRSHNSPPPCRRFVIKSFQITLSCFRTNFPITEGFRCALNMIIICVLE